MFEQNTPWTPDDTGQVRDAADRSGTATPPARDQPVPTGLSGADPALGLSSPDQGPEPDSGPAPDSPEAYEFNLEGLDPEEAASLGKELGQMAYSAGLSPRQAQTLGERVLAQHQALAQSLSRERADGEAALRQAWGGRYEENLSLARKALQSLGGPEFSEYLNATGLGNHPAMVRMFHTIGVRISEDSLELGDGAAPPGSRPTTSDGRPALFFPSMEGRLAATS